MHSSALNPPPLDVKPTVGKLEVLKPELVFFNQAARATLAFVLRAETYAASEVPKLVAGRTRGVLGHVAGTGAYAERAIRFSTGAAEVKAERETSARLSDWESIVTTAAEKKWPRKLETVEKDKQTLASDKYLYLTPIAN